MKLELRDNKDFWTGLMFMGIGAGALFVARDYRFGSALSMGPGFFPRVLSGILIAFGACLIGLGLRSNEKIAEKVSPRALVLMPLSLVLFGILMDRAGLIPALVALILVSAVSGREFKFREVLPLTVVLIVMVVALFIWGLGMPYPLLKGF